MTAQTTHRILIGWLILALLFAQGLRVCMHPYDNSAHPAYPGGVTSSHLESSFSTLFSGEFGGEDQIAADVHVPLFSLLMSFSAELFIAIVGAVLLIVLLTPQRVMRLLWRDDTVLKIRFSRHFTPPLRAPPR